MSFRGSRIWGELNEAKTVAERRAVARERSGQNVQSGQTDHLPPHSCLYCCGQLTNGSPVCCEACDHGWWDVVPCTDGEIWTPRPSVL